VTHSLSVGIPVGTPTVGALTLDSTTGRAFSEVAEQLVASVTDPTGGNRTRPQNRA
jgi:hypothetical protein